MIPKVSDVLVWQTKAQTENLALLCDAGVGCQIMNIVKKSVSSPNDVEPVEVDVLHCAVDDGASNVSDASPNAQPPNVDIGMVATGSQVANGDNTTENNLPEVVKVLRNVASNVETISDCIATSEDIKKLKHVQGRSNSTGRLYNSSRRVSFPENDSELVTGYLEPADPWAFGMYSDRH